MSTKHKDGSIDTLIKQMLEDRRDNPKGRTDRQKYIAKGYPLNDVRRAAEAVSEIWPLFLKYGNFLECQEVKEENRKLRAAFSSINQRMEEQQKRMEEHEEGKPEMEELKRQLKENERLRNEVEQARRGNTGQMQRKLHEQEEEIKMLKEETEKSSKLTAELKHELLYKDRLVGVLEGEQEQVQEYVERIKDESAESLRRMKIISRKIFAGETALVAILLVLLLGGHALYVMAIGIIQAGWSFTAMIAHGIYAVSSSFKPTAIWALHYVNHHIMLFDQSMVSFLKSAFIFFLIIFLIILIMSVSNKR